MIILFNIIRGCVIGACCWGIVRFFYWYKYYNDRLKDGNFHHIYTHKQQYIKQAAKLPRFTFKQFLQFYKLNPNQWEFYNNDPHSDYYKKIKFFPARIETKHHNRAIGYHSSSEWIEYLYYPIFFTNMFEYRKYTKWAKKELARLINLENNQAQDEATRQIISFVNGDIEKARAQMEQALNNTEKTLVTTLNYLNNQENKIIHASSLEEVENSQIAKIKGDIAICQGQIYMYDGNTYYAVY